jgi:hypothetical protein
MFVDGQLRLLAKGLLLMALDGDGVFVRVNRAMPRLSHLCAEGLSFGMGRLFLGVGCLSFGLRWLVVLLADKLQKRMVGKRAFVPFGDRCLSAAIFPEEPLDL